MVYLDLPSIGTEGSLGPGVNRLSSLWCLWIWMVVFKLSSHPLPLGQDTCTTMAAMGVEGVGQAPA